MSKYLETLIENMLADNVSENDIRKVIEEVTKKSPLRQGVVGTTSGVSTTQEGITIGEQGEIIKPEIKTGVEVIKEERELVEKTDKDKCEDQDGMCWDEQRSRCARCEVEEEDCDPDGSKKKACEDEGGTFSPSDCGCTTQEELEERIKTAQELDIRVDEKKYDPEEIRKKKEKEKKLDILTGDYLINANAILDRNKDFLDLIFPTKGAKEGDTRPGLTKHFSERIYEDLFSDYLIRNEFSREQEEEIKIYNSVVAALKKLEEQKKTDTEEYKALKQQENDIMNKPGFSERIFAPGFGEREVNLMFNKDMSEEEFIYNYLKQNQPQYEVYKNGKKTWVDYQLPSSYKDLKLEDLYRLEIPKGHVRVTDWEGMEQYDIWVQKAKLLYNAFKQYHEQGYITEGIIGAIDESIHGLTVERGHSRINSLWEEEAIKISLEIIDSTIGREKWRDSFYANEREKIIHAIAEKGWLVDRPGLISLINEVIIRDTPVDISALSDREFEEWLDKSIQDQEHRLLMLNILYKEAYNELQEVYNSEAYIQQIKKLRTEHNPAVVKARYLERLLKKHEGAYREVGRVLKESDKISWKTEKKVRINAINRYFKKLLINSNFEVGKKSNVKDVFEQKQGEFYFENFFNIDISSVEIGDNYWKALEEYILEIGGAQYLKDFEKCFLSQTDWKTLKEIPALEFEEVIIDGAGVYMVVAPSWLRAKVRKGTVLNTDYFLEGFAESEIGKTSLNNAIAQIRQEYIQKEMYHLEGKYGQRLLQSYVSNPLAVEENNSKYINSAIRQGQIDEHLYSLRWKKNAKTGKRHRPGEDRLIGKSYFDIQLKPQDWNGRWYVSVKHRLMGIRPNPNDPSKLLNWPDGDIGWVSGQAIEDVNMELNAFQKRIKNEIQDIEGSLRAYSGKGENPIKIEIDGEEMEGGYIGLYKERRRIINDITKFTITMVNSPNKEFDSIVYKGLVDTFNKIDEAFKKYDVEEKLQQLHYDLEKIQDWGDDYQNLVVEMQKTLPVNNAWRKKYGMHPLSAKAWLNLGIMVHDMLIALTAGQSEWLKNQRRMLAKSKNEDYAMPYKADWGSVWLKFSSTVDEGAATLATWSLALTPLGFWATGSAFFLQTYGSKFMSIEDAKETAIKERAIIQTKLNESNKNRESVIQALKKEDIESPSEQDIQRKAKEMGVKVLQQWEVNDYLSQVVDLNHQADISGAVHQIVSILTGAGEVGSEALGTLKILKGIHNYRKALRAEISLAKRGLLLTGLTIGGVTIEYAEEIANQIFGNFLDNIFNIHGREDVSLLDGINKDFTIDVITLSLIMMSPGITQQVVAVFKKEFQTKEDRKKNAELVAKLKALNDRIAELRSIKKPNKSDIKELKEKMEEVEKTIKEMVVADFKTVQTAIEIFDDPSILKQFMDLSRRRAELQKDIAQHAHDNAGKILSNSSKKRLAELTKKWNDLQAEMQALVDNNTGIENNKPEVRDAKGEIVTDAKGVELDYAVDAERTFYYNLYNANLLHAEQACKRSGNLFNKIDEKNTTFNKETNRYELTKEYESELLDHFMKKRKMTKEQAQGKIEEIKTALKKGNNALVTPDGDVFCFTENAYRTILNTPGREIIYDENGNIIGFGKIVTDLFTLLDAGDAAVSPLHEIFHNWHTNTGIVVDGRLRESSEEAILELDDLMKKKYKAGKMSLEAYNHYEKKRKGLKNAPNEVEEILHIIGDMMSYGAIDKGSFAGSGLVSVKLMLNDLLKAVANKVTPTVTSTETNTELKSPLIAALERKLLDFTSAEQAFNYISNFYRRDLSKVKIKPIAPPPEEDVDIKSSRGAYVDEENNLQSEVKILKETKPEGWENQIKLLELNITKIQKNIEISDRNAKNIVIYKREIAKFEKNPKAGKSVALIRAENALYQDNIGIIEDFFNNNFDPYAAEFSGIDEFDFRSAMQETIARIYKNFDLDAGTDFGYYLKDRLSYQQGNILEAAKKGRMENTVNIDEKDLIKVIDQNTSDDMDAGDRYDLNNKDSEVETGEFRKLIGLEEGAPLYKKVQEINDNWILNNPGLEIGSKQYRKMYKEMIIPLIKDSIVKAIGTMKSDKRRDFLKLNGQKIINLLAVSHKNRFKFLSISGGRMTVPLSRKLQNSEYSGIITNAEAGNEFWVVKQLEITEEMRDDLLESGFSNEFIDDLLITEEDFLNYFMAGRETVSTALVEEIANELGQDDLHSAIIRTQPENVEAWINKITDDFKRDPSMKFSTGVNIEGVVFGRTFRLPLHYDSKNLQKNCLGINVLIENEGLEDVVNEEEMILFNSEKVEGKPGVYSHKGLITKENPNGEYTKLEVAFVTWIREQLGTEDVTNKKYTNAIKDGELNIPEIIVKQFKDNGPIRNNKNAKNNYYKDIQGLVSALPSELIEKIGPSLFGFHYKYLDSGATKQGPKRTDEPTGRKERRKYFEKLKNNQSHKGKTSLLVKGWKFDPNLDGGMFIKIDEKENNVFENGELVTSIDPVGDPNIKAELVRGEFYEREQKLLDIARKSKVKSDIVFDAIRLMNKNIPLKDGGIFKRLDEILDDGTLNRQQKLQKIQSSGLADDIRAANEVNIQSVSLIVKTAVERVRDGKMDLINLMYLLQMQTNLSERGIRALSRLDFITVLDTIREGITKGEHLNPNANLMLEILELAVDYIQFDDNGIAVDFNETIDIEAEINSIFSKHTQWYTMKYLTDLVDKGGVEDGPRIFQNSELNYKRLTNYLPTEHQDDVLGINGEDMLTKIIELETATLIKDQTIRIQKQQEAIDNILKGEINEIFIADFDDTARIEGEEVVIAKKKGSPTITIPSHEFPNKAPILANQGYEFDFTNFIMVEGGIKGPYFQEMKKAEEGFEEGEKGVILTARPFLSAEHVTRWLEANGLDPNKWEIVALQDGSPEAKAKWIEENIVISMRANKIRFADDSLANVKAVMAMFEEYPADLFYAETVFVTPEFLEIKTKPNNPDIKSDQPYSKLSRGAIFNDILFQTTGVDKNKIFSDAQARMTGTKKDGLNWENLKTQNVWRYFLTPSADNLLGLIGDFIAKGEVGKQQMEWFKKNLIMPYNSAMNTVSGDRVRINSLYSKLKKDIKKAKKKLKRNVPGTKNLTYDHAVRVYLWNKAGIDMVKDHGMSQRDLDACLKAIDNDLILQSFAYQLNEIAQHDGSYIKPTEFWVIETISQDIARLINQVNREDHLKDFIQARKEIFGEWENKKLTGPNINKIEAIYGSKYRDALEDMLYRMEFDKYRESGLNATDNKAKNMTNAAVATVMFLNTRSALTQVLSFGNYFKITGPNNPIEALKTASDVEQWGLDIGYLLNSDFIKTRWKRLDIGVNERDIADRLSKSDKPWKAITAYLLEKGYTLTQIGDILAILMGGSIYFGSYRRHYIKTLTKEKEIELGRELNDAEKQQVWDQATRLAYDDFVWETVTGQQSGRADQISQEQAGHIGRLLLAFKTTSAQYTRKIRDAAEGIRKGTGNAAQHFWDIAYYAGIQNFMFTAMQQALFAALDDDEEWDNSLNNVLQSMLSNFLYGFGYRGIITATIKDGILEFKEQEEKGFRADHTNTIIQLANFAPPIGIKLRQIYTAIQTGKYDKDAIGAMKHWDPQNPEWVIVANVITAFTSFPAAQIQSKINTCIEVFINRGGVEREFWQELAMILGWKAWNVNTVTYPDIIKEDAKIQNKKIKEETKISEALQEIQGIVTLEKEDEIKRLKEGLPAIEYECAYVNSENKRCGVYVEDAGQLCNYHDPKNAKQCKQIKSDKDPCKNTTTNESGYCYLHNDGKF